MHCWAWWPVKAPQAWWGVGKAWASLSTAGFHTLVSSVINQVLPGLVWWGPGHGIQSYSRNPHASGPCSQPRPSRSWQVSVHQWALQLVLGHPGPPSPLNDHNRESQNCGCWVKQSLSDISLNDCFAQLPKILVPIMFVIWGLSALLKRLLRKLQGLTHIVAVNQDKENKK